MQHLRLICSNGPRPPGTPPTDPAGPGGRPASEPIRPPTPGTQSQVITPARASHTSRLWCVECGILGGRTHRRRRGRRRPGGRALAERPLAVGLQQRRPATRVINSSLQLQSGFSTGVAAAAAGILHRALQLLQVVTRLERGQPAQPLRPLLEQLSLDGPFEQISRRDAMHPQLNVLTAQV